MATIQTFKDFNVQILTETVRGAFAQKNAFMNSVLASQGAVVVQDGMPAFGPAFIGNEITIPYFGTLGEFVSNPDGTAVSVSDIALMNEKATVIRESMAFEVSRWAQASGPQDADPYEEASSQIVEASGRSMDKLIIAEANNTPFIYDVYDASTPQNLDVDVLSDARGELWGDENSDIVAMVAHSRTVTSLRKLRDANGRPLLLENFAEGNDVPRFMGVPIVESDRAPITGTAMGSVTSVGTGSEPTMTISGTPLGLWQFRVRVYDGTALETARFQFSTDAGRHWSAPIVTAASGVAKACIDTNTDSLVGLNGKSGLLVAFNGNFTSATDNVFGANAAPKLNTLVIKRGACAFWYNRAQMGLETDKDILKHTDIAAMHLYAAPHRYRRVSYGTKGGVVKIVHNGPTFKAITTSHLTSLAIA